MKYIQRLEEYALSVSRFPWRDLEVDTKKEDGKVVVSLYWTNDKGNTEHRDVAWIPQDKYHSWVFTEKAERVIKTNVYRLFASEYKDYPFKVSKNGMTVTTQLCY